MDGLKPLNLFLLRPLRVKRIYNIVLRFFSQVVQLSLYVITKLNNFT